MRRCRRSWSTPSRARWTRCSTPRRARGSTRSGASSCMKARAGCRTTIVEAHLADTVAIVGQTDLDAERIAPRAGAAGGRQRRGQLPAQRRLRGLLRARDPRARRQPGVRAGGGRGGARHGHRPRARDHARPTARCAPAPRPTGWRPTRLLPAGRQRRRGHRVRRPRPRARAAARAVRLPRARLRPVAARPRHRAAGAEPAGLDELLRASRVVFVFAARDERERALLGRARARAAAGRRRAAA